MWTSIQSEPGWPRRLRPVVSPPPICGFRPRCVPKLGRIAAHDPSRDTSSAADDWLSPIYLDERRDERQDPQPARRASNRGFLPLTTRDYLEILDWTGRQLRGGTPGKIPDHLAPILERLGLVPRSWLATVENFGRWFHRAIGAASAMSAEATARGQKWLVGIGHCRTSFQ